MKNRIIIIVTGAVLAVSAIFFMFNFKKIFSSSSNKQTGSISLQSAYASAIDLETKGRLLEAKKIYQDLLNNFSSSPEVMKWQKKIEDLNMKLLFSPVITEKGILYEIKPGDSLTKIAKQFKTTVELIKKANNISSDKIFPGKKIKIWTAPLSIVVDKSQNTLMLKSDEEIIREYIVSTGKNNSTPTGTFKIVNKLANPTWFKAGAVIASGSPENVLGARWLGFDLSGYGIHGTVEPENLGKQVTEGCVRMNNSEVEELYAIVPEGTEVTIVD